VENRRIFYLRSSCVIKIPGDFVLQWEDEEDPRKVYSIKSEKVI